MAGKSLRVVRHQAAHPDNVTAQHVQYGTKLVSVHLPPGLPQYERILEELHEYREVLLGRVRPPVLSPYLGLAEVAAAYYARARELEQLIYIGEQDGSITRGSQYYKLRTGTLGSFIQMASKLYDLGSRRLTQEDLLTRQRIDAGEAY